MFDLPERIDNQFFYKNGRYLNREGQKLSPSESEQLRGILLSTPVVGSTMLPRLAAIEYSLWTDKAGQTVAWHNGLTEGAFQKIVAAVGEPGLYDYLWPTKPNRRHRWGKRQTGMAPGYEDVE